MKTFTTPDIASSLFTRMHSFMAVAGVVIALVCSSVVFQKTNGSNQEQAKQSSIIGSSKIEQVKSLSVFVIQSVMK